MVKRGGVYEMVLIKISYVLNGKFCIKLPMPIMILKLCYVKSSYDDY